MFCTGLSLCGNCFIVITSTCFACVGLCVYGVYIHTPRELCSYAIGCSSCNDDSFDTMTIVDAYILLD